MEIKTSGDYYYITYTVKGIKKRTPSFKSELEVMYWVKANNIKLWDNK